MRGWWWEERRREREKESLSFSKGLREIFFSSSSFPVFLGASWRERERELFKEQERRILIALLACSSGLLFSREESAKKSGKERVAKERKPSRVSRAPPERARTREGVPFFFSLFSLKLPNSLLFEPRSPSLFSFSRADGSLARERGCSTCKQGPEAEPLWAGERRESARKKKRERESEMGRGGGAAAAALASREKVSILLLCIFFSLFSHPEGSIIKRKQAPMCKEESRKACGEAWRKAPPPVFFPLSFY